MKYMMDTDDLANKLRSFTLVAVVVKVSAALQQLYLCVCSRRHRPQQLVLLSLNFGVPALPSVFWS